MTSFWSTFFDVHDLGHDKATACHMASSETVGTAFGKAPAVPKVLE
jgi:hypothetical protein